MIIKIINDPFKIISYFLGMTYFCLLSFFDKRIKVGKRLKIFGIPLIDIRGNCSISIGDNVFLNSRNKGYFAGLYGPVKLFVDGENAFIKIGNNTRIHGVCIHAYKSIEIGDNCLIAGNTTIVDSDGHDPFPADISERLKTKKDGIPVVIEDNVWIGLNCIILKGVKIGQGSIIGAGSVIRKSIPPYSIVMGNPAIVVKTLNPET
jgi:acetyltransferase-like isoleucine patch superfamily enzyme